MAGRDRWGPRPGGRGDLAKRFPDRPTLIGLRGCDYCQLLLEQARDRDGLRAVLGRARASLAVVKRPRPDPARTDLEAAFAIARRGNMPSHLADCALLDGHLHRTARAAQAGPPDPIPEAARAESRIRTIGQWGLWEALGRVGEEIGVGVDAEPPGRR